MREPEREVMDQLNLILVVAAGVVIAIGLVSDALKRSLLQEPMVAVLVGLAVGPNALGVLDVAEWGDENRILEQAARITLAIGLMGVALRLKKESVGQLLRPVGALLTIGMLGMWLTSSAVAGWILDLPFWTALLVGAVVTPTDPVVASSIVTGKFASEHLPRRLRDAISFESGANDGLAYLFVMLPILMIGQGASEVAWSTWLMESLLIGVVGGAAIGCTVGYAAAKLLQFAERRGLIENASLLGYTVAFSLLTLGAAALLRADALISVFLAGLVFNLSIGDREEHEEETIQEAVSKLFTLPMFVIFGVAVPVGEWLAQGWPLLAFAGLILLLRRPPALGATFPLLRPLTARDAAYAGWFGPVGIAALYYATFATEHVAEPVIWNAASAVVFASMMAHGLTAAPLTKLYALRQPGSREPEQD